MRDEGERPRRNLTAAETREGGVDPATGTKTGEGFESGEEGDDGA